MVSVAVPCVETFVKDNVQAVTKNPASKLISTIQNVFISVTLSYGLELCHLCSRDIHISVDWSRYLFDSNQRGSNRA